MSGLTEPTENENEFEVGDDELEDDPDDEDEFEDDPEDNEEPGDDEDDEFEDEPDEDESIPQTPIEKEKEKLKAERAEKRKLKAELKKLKEEKADSDAEAEKFKAANEKNIEKVSSLRKENKQKEKERDEIIRAANEDVAFIPTVDGINPIEMGIKTFKENDIDPNDDGGGKDLYIGKWYNFVIFRQHKGIQTKLTKTSYSRVWQGAQHMKDFLQTEWGFGGYTLMVFDPTKAGSGTKVAHKTYDIHPPTDEEVKEKAEKIAPAIEKPPNDNQELYYLRQEMQNMRNEFQGKENNSDNGVTTAMLEMSRQQAATAAAAAANQQALLVTLLTTMMESNKNNQQAAQPPLSTIEIIKLAKSLMPNKVEGMSGVKDAFELIEQIKKQTDPTLADTVLANIGAIAGEFMKNGILAGVMQAPKQIEQQQVEQPQNKPEKTKTEIEEEIQMRNLQRTIAVILEDVAIKFHEDEALTVEDDIKEYTLTVLNSGKANIDLLLALPSGELGKLFYSSASRLMQLEMEKNDYEHLKTITIIGVEIQNWVNIAVMQEDYKLENEYPDVIERFNQLIEPPDLSGDKLSGDKNDNESGESATGENKTSSDAENAVA